MDAKNIIKEAGRQIKGKYASYTFALFLCTLLSTFLSVYVSAEIVTMHSFYYVLYLMITVLMIIGRNTVYFLFIKRLRKERFTKEDVTYSFRNWWLHIATAFLFELYQWALLIVIRQIVSIVPSLAVPLVLIIQALLSSVPVFIAFAIYDGVKKTVKIVNGSIHLLFLQYQKLFVIALPLLIWLLLYQTASNLLTMQMSTDAGITLMEMLETAMESGTLNHYAYLYIALELIHMIVSSCLLSVLYMAYAAVYDESYIHIYPFEAVISANVIDIGSVEEEEQ